MRGLHAVAFTAALGLSIASALSGCGGPPQPADPKVTADVIKACTGSGLFKMADGTAATLVPSLELPVALVNAGIDRICADPAAVAGDIALAQYWVRYLRGLAK